MHPSRALLRCPQASIYKNAELSALIVALGLGAGATGDGADKAKGAKGKAGAKKGAAAAAAAAPATAAASSEAGQAAANLLDGLRWVGQRGLPALLLCAAVKSMPNVTCAFPLTEAGAVGDGR